MGACVTNCQTSHRANAKNNREVILKKWDFINFFVPLPKAINDILLKTVISLFYCNCRGRAVSESHIGISSIVWFFFFKPKKETKQVREEWWRARKQWQSLIHSFLIPMTAGAGLLQGWDSHRRGYDEKAKSIIRELTFEQIKKTWIPYLGWFWGFLKQRHNN